MFQIIYGCGINTEAADTLLSSPPSLFAPASLQGKWTSVHGPIYLPPKDVYSGGVLKIKPETDSRIFRLAAMSPVKMADPSIDLMCRKISKPKSSSDSTSTLTN